MTNIDGKSCLLASLPAHSPDSDSCRASCSCPVDCCRPPFLIGAPHPPMCRQLARISRVAIYASCSQAYPSDALLAIQPDHEHLAVDVLAALVRPPSVVCTRNRLLAFVLVASTGLLLSPPKCVATKHNSYGQAPFCVYCPLSGLVSTS